MEEKFKGSFLDCAVGAMPPFGNLYGLKVYVDHSLTEDEEIVFDAGTNQEGFKDAIQGFRRACEPRRRGISSSALENLRRA